MFTDHLLRILYLAAVAFPLSAAQAQPAGVSAPVANDHFAFEVVSIRRHNAQNGPVQTGATPEGYRSVGLPLFGIFQWAYALPDAPGLLRGDQIEGDPDWLSSELYDVVAKVGQADLAAWQKPETRQTMLRAMLRTMLAERCKVLTHYAAREEAVYNLVVARGGPKFKQAETIDVAELRREHPTAGMMRGTGTFSVRDPQSTRFYAISIALLSNTILSSLVDRPVIDKTRLTGYFDLSLPTLALQRTPPTPPAVSQPNAAPTPVLEDAPIFAALRDAAGLRLEPAKGRIQTLVIDRVERPSEN